VVRRRTTVDARRRHSTLSICLGEAASIALDLPRNDCIDAFVWLLASAGTPFPGLPAEPSVVRAVAMWVMANDDARAAVVAWNEEHEPTEDPLARVRRWA
jgi:hypothetical protein